jgi:hypothetical protein
MRTPGSGSIHGYGYLDGNSAGGVAGLGLDLEAKIRADLGLFASGRAGYSWRNGTSGLTYEALFGIAGTW